MGARRAIPWLTYYEVARTIALRARGGWNALTPAERRRLQAIVRDSGGRPAAVPAEQRRELRRLVTKALRGMASL